MILMLTVNNDIHLFPSDGIEGALIAALRIAQGRHLL